MSIQKFTELRVRQIAHQVSLKIDKVTRGFPADERFGLVSQVRRAAVSVAANIAEGFGRWSLRDRARFLEMAKSSAEEVRHYLILSVDLEYVKSDPALDGQIDHLCAMLYRAREAVLSSEGN